MNTPHSLRQVRPAAVAGMFYPRAPAALGQQIEAMLADARAELGEPDAGIPKALIVPHAGYIYSGSTAAYAYACLEQARSRIRRVLLLGPAHRVALRGLALPGCAALATPLGEVAVDQAGVAALADLPQVVLSAAAHAFEHALEVQLPFLQTVLNQFTLVPLVVGAATPDEVQQVLERLWGDTETLILISSDLSHFLPYAQACASDRATVQDILDLRASIEPGQACGATAINGLLLAAQRQRLRAQLLHLCNSGDSAGDQQRVVGYAAIAFREEA